VIRGVLQGAPQSLPRMAGNSIQREIPPMSGSSNPTAAKVEHIDVTYDWELCVWARHFNTSEKSVKEAVAAVGNRADRVRDHLATRRDRASERPSSR